MKLICKTSAPFSSVLKLSTISVRCFAAILPLIVQHRKPHLTRWRSVISSIAVHWDTITLQKKQTNISGANWWYWKAYKILIDYEASMYSPFLFRLIFATALDLLQFVNNCLQLFTQLTMTLANHSQKNVETIYASSMALFKDWCVEP